MHLRAPAPVLRSVRDLADAGTALAPVGTSVHDPYVTPVEDVRRAFQPGSGSLRPVHGRQLHGHDDSRRHHGGPVWPESPGGAWVSRHGRGGSAGADPLQGACMTNAVMQARKLPLPVSHNVLATARDGRQIGLSD